MKRLNYLIFGLVIFFPAVALAFNVDSTRPSNAPFTTVPALVKRLFEFGITIGGIIFIILFLVGGITYLTSAGDKDGVEKAKKMMVDAIIGLILILSAWAVSTFIYNQLTSGTPPNIAPNPAPTVPAPTATNPVPPATPP